MLIYRIKYAKCVRTFLENEHSIYNLIVINATAHTHKRPGSVHSPHLTPTTRNRDIRNYLPCAQHKHAWACYTLFSIFLSFGFFFSIVMLMTSAVAVVSQCNQSTCKNDQYNKELRPLDSQTPLHFGKRAQHTEINSFLCQAKLVEQLSCPWN